MIREFSGVVDSEFLAEQVYSAMNSVSVIEAAAELAPATEEIEITSEMIGAGKTALTAWIDKYDALDAHAWPSSREGELVASILSSSKEKTMPGPGC